MCTDVRVMMPCVCVSTYDDGASVCVCVQMRECVCMCTDVRVMMPCACVSTYDDGASEYVCVQM